MNLRCKVKVILNDTVLILGVESFNIIITRPVFTFSSGQGPTRVNSLTHDTKKALVQTTAGQIEVCKHLFQKGFTYVLLRDLQSDRIEGEFSVYRQSTGANSYMVASDVLSCFKRRLSRFAASNLESLDFAADSPAHICKGVDYGDAAAIEACLREEGLSEMEEIFCAYVAGWLESKCKDLDISDTEWEVSGKKKFHEDPLPSLMLLLLNL